MYLLGQLIQENNRMCQKCTSNLTEQLGMGQNDQPQKLIVSTKHKQFCGPIWYLNFDIIGLPTKYSNIRLGFA
jgi:hypothetical protein